MNNLVNTSALLCSKRARISPQRTSREQNTDPIRLRDVHVPVSVVVHLLVNAPDGLETEDGVFVLAEGLVDAAQLWKEDRRWGVMKKYNKIRIYIFSNKRSIKPSISHVCSRIHGGGR